MPTATISSRTLLVTLLGAFTRQTDDWMPVSAIVALLAELGADESSIRTSVSRLKKRKWLEPVKRNGRSGYQLTAVAKDALAAGDRVIWHPRQPAELEDGWCIASFSVPEKDRSQRHLLRSRLAALGFGNVGPGVWIAPARMQSDALELIESLDLREYTNVFVGSHEGGQDLARMIRTGWDLNDLNDRYQAFVAKHAKALDQAVAPSAIAPREAFVRYMLALDDWRVLPLRDPGLPRELLSSDWAGDDAVKLLEGIVEALGGPALTFVRSVVSS